MSRIATITTVLTMLVAPAAFAGPADYRAPDNHTADRAAQTRFYQGSVLVTRDVHRTAVGATPAKFYLGSELVKRSADGTIVSAAPTQVDLRSPSTAPQSSDNDVDWGTIGIIVGGLALCAGLAVMLRRHLNVGRPLGV